MTMPKTILTDSSFLYALADRSDKFHTQAVAFAKINTRQQIVPDIVLTEVTHLLRHRLGHQAMMAFVTALPIAKNTQLIAITMPDIARAAAIMSAYPNARLDFVDCCMVALAERLNIRAICTFDRRDFSIIVPVDGAFLELLP